MTAKTPPDLRLAVGLLSDGTVFMEYKATGEYFQLSPEQARELAAALNEAARLAPLKVRTQ